MQPDTEQPAAPTDAAVNSLSVPTGAAAPGQLADAVIRTRGLVKHFGRFRALDGLDLEVAPGEVHGFLGPNGAGKSTTIRILLGLMRSGGGTAEVLGHDPWHDAVRLHRRLAYVPGDVTLWPGLTGGQCIDVLARAHGGLSGKRRAELVDRFDLDESKRARDYSTGNRQKVMLVAALASDVDLLILDEPTSGLDPLMEKTFQECVSERRSAGCTVLLSSHILGEVEELADRVSIIRQGRTVRSGTLADLRRQARVSVYATTWEPVDGLGRIPGVTATETRPASGDATTVSFTVDTEHLDDAIGVVHAAGIATLTTMPPSLDELFLTSYQTTCPPAAINAERGDHR